MRRILPFCLLLLAATAMPAAAQDTVVPAENVRMDYAQVLRVEPVFQTLTATRMEQQCDDQRPPPSKADAKGLSRIVGVVKDVLRQDGEVAGQAAASGDAAGCRMVPVQRAFRRPIAFDVDYLYKGGKYRSRLPEDPGNRLRVRVSVTPDVSPASER